MKISELIDIRVSYNKSIKSKLIEMVCFFQEYMWNGWEDENDPKFVTQADYEAIEALTDKMEHMILNIGCPLSVEKMLKSITERKLKTWASCNGNTFERGQQLRTKAQKRIQHNEWYSNWNRGRMTETGHFRWNRQAYTLSRRATDLLELYLQTRY